MTKQWINAIAIGWYEYNDGNDFWIHYNSMERRDNRDSIYFACIKYHLNARYDNFRLNKNAQ